MRTIAEYTREKRLLAERISRDMVSRLNPQRILLFGSVAREEARETSDVDLIAIAESEMSFKERMNYLYSEIERHEDIDMLWYTPEELERMKKTSSFVRHALEEGVLLYERRS